MKNVYALFTDGIKDALHLQPKNQQLDFDNLFREGSNEIVEYLYMQGKKPYDLISCGFVQLISEKLKNLLVENNITGWKTYPIKIYDKKGNSLKDYFGLSITGKCGSIINEKSENRTMPPMVSGGPTYEARIGLFFDESKWDGSDIFSPMGTYYIFVSEEVKTLIKQNNITNVHFEPISELENFNL